MAEKLVLELVSPERQLLREEVSEVTAPGSEGEFGILPGHRPFLTTLKAGIIRFVKDGKPEFLAISGGFAEISNNEVMIMANTAEFRSEIDVQRAQRAKAEAEEQLKQLERTKDEEQFAHFAAKLERAVTRITVASIEMH